MTDEEKKSDGYRSHQSSQMDTSLTSKDGAEVSYKGCTTWPEMRRLCAQEGRTVIHEGKHPCYACVAPGCCWNSKKQGWSEGEASLANHIRAVGENEEKFWKKKPGEDPPTTEELEKVVHPGRKWYKQVSPNEETEEEMKDRLMKAGIIMKKEKKAKTSDNGWGDGS